jgi:hypothetical protein
MSIPFQHARERLYEAKLEKLGEVYQWIEQYHQLWAGSLHALKNLTKQEELQFQSAGATCTGNRKHSTRQKR